ncbi:MAG: NAD(P)-dependent oxidoreductase [Myxococcota bacterium]|nr:NAD(P)-dependent oxidoreductase [Myxococcota bacterium]
MPKPRLSRWVVSSYETEADIASEIAAIGSRAEVIGLKRDAEILVVTSSIAVDAALLAHTPSARLVITTTSGYDHLDLKLLAERGIAACRLPLVRRDAVVEASLAMLIDGLRCLDAYRVAAEAGEWIRHQMPALAPKTLTGSRVGLVGLGVIGQRMAEMLSVLGAEVWGLDPAGVPSGIRPATLTEMLSQCDAVSLHCRLTEENRGMIGATQLRSVAPGLVLVNTARGGLLDLDACITALDDGRLRALGVDVFPEEPWPRLADAARPGVLFTPHSAGYHTRLPLRVREGIVDAVTAWTTGAPLPWALLAGTVPA